MANAKSYVITGTNGGPGVDNTSEVVLEADASGNPTKVIGVDRPCELTATDKETLDNLGIEIDESNASTDDSSSAPEAGSDTAAAGPRIS